MERRPLGGRDVAAIGQGTWEMEQTRDAAIAALRRGLDLGLDHIDTAEMYGAGRVEELVGEAIQGRREQVFLVSKVLPSNASRSGTIAACERSLRRLGTDHLDLYLLHWPGAEPLAETIAAFDELVAAGKIRAYGVSNFDVDLLEEAVRLAGPGRIACNQVLLHLEERAVETALLGRCRHHEVALVAYSPFGQGAFPDPRSVGGRVLAEVAARHGVSPYQVALRFLLREPGVLVIPKAARIEHVEANAAADRLVLDDDDLARIDAAFPRGEGRDLPVL